MSSVNPLCGRDSAESTRSRVGDPYVGALCSPDSMCPARVRLTTFLSFVDSQLWGARSLSLGYPLSMMDYGSMLRQVLLRVPLGLSYVGPCLDACLLWIVSISGTLDACFGMLESDARVGV